MLHLVHFIKYIENVTCKKKEAYPLLEQCFC